MTTCSPGVHLNPREGYLYVRTAKEKKGAYVEREVTIRKKIQAIIEGWRNPTVQTDKNLASLEIFISKAPEDLRQKLQFTLKEWENSSSISSKVAPEETSYPRRVKRVHLEGRVLEEVDIFPVTEMENPGSPLVEDFKALKPGILERKKTVSALSIIEEDDLEIYREEVKTQFVIQGHRPLQFIPLENEKKLEDLTSKEEKPDLNEMIVKAVRHHFLHFFWKIFPSSTINEQDVHQWVERTLYIHPCTWEENSVCRTLYELAISVSLLQKEAEAAAKPRLWFLEDL